MNFWCLLWMRKYILDSHKLLLCLPASLLCLPWALPLSSLIPQRKYCTISFLINFFPKSSSILSPATTQIPTKVQSFISDCFHCPLQPAERTFFFLLMIAFGREGSHGLPAPRCALMSFCSSTFQTPSSYPETFHL